MSGPLQGLLGYPSTQAIGMKAIQANEHLRSHETCVSDREKQSEKSLLANDTLQKGHKSSALCMSLNHMLAPQTSIHHTFTALKKPLIICVNLWKIWYFGPNKQWKIALRYEYYPTWWINFAFRKHNIYIPSIKVRDKCLSLRVFNTQWCPLTRVAYHLGWKSNSVLWFI